MQELKTLIQSPAFWIGSVIVGFLMSFVASYAKEWTDKWFAVRTEKRDAETQRRIELFKEKVERLRADPNLLSLYQTNIVYQKLRQVLYLTVFYFCIALSVYATLKSEFSAAVGVLLFGLTIMAIQARHVTRRLDELRAPVNAVLGDRETHFIG